MSTDNRRTLGTFGGVFSPVTLAQFSSVIFLRLGFLVGQNGMIFSLFQLLIAYIILLLTIFSISAISTNGAVSGGGVYYMLSRTIGPQLGGAIGILFFFSQVFSAALYISAAVEGIAANFGPQGTLVEGGLPGDTRWWLYLYCVLVTIICGIILFIGSSLFAKLSSVILGVVVIVIGCVLASFFQAGFAVPIPKSNQIIYGDLTNVTHYAQFTGFNTNTLVSNLYQNYTVDYVSGNEMSFVISFAVLISGITGIMNGANMSGELINPAKAIPEGTIGAVAFTFAIYTLLTMFTAATCDRRLLINNYIYMQSIAFWQPIVVVGILATTLSAALGNLIGASRILEALANDNLFGVILAPAKYTTKSGNPIFAVLITIILVQVVLLIGSLNAIAPAVCVCFLVAYAIVNFACMILDIASAANFRPLFRYIHWLPSLVGGVSCLFMSGIVNHYYTLVVIVLLVLIAFGLSLRPLPKSWGNVSQALLFHQVRKYLLLLDDRKSHMKYWRPQLILLISNPLTSASLVQFMNSVKKGGLYVLGHVNMERKATSDDSATATQSSSVVSTDDYDTCKSQWRAYAEDLKVKAFVEITSCAGRDALAAAMLHLVRLSGLGAMKPNTVCLGFYDDYPLKDTYAQVKKRPKNTLGSHRWLNQRKHGINVGDENNLVENEFYGGNEDEKDTSECTFQQWSEFKESKHQLTKSEYIGVLHDLLKMNKNLIVARHFSDLWNDELKLDDAASQSPSQFEAETSPMTQQTFVCPVTEKVVALNCYVHDGNIQQMNSPINDVNTGYKGIMNKINSVKSKVVPPSHNSYLDLWPVNVLNFMKDINFDTSLIDLTGKFMMQIGCLVGRAKKMNKEIAPYRIRVMIPMRVPSANASPESLDSPVSTVERIELIKNNVAQLVVSLRINAEVIIVPMKMDEAGISSTALSMQHIQQMNRTMRRQCSTDTSVVMVHLHTMKENQLLHESCNSSDSEESFYLETLTQLSNELPPTLFIHGLQEVTSVDL